MFKSSKTQSNSGLLRFNILWGHGPLPLPPHAHTHTHTHTQTPVPTPLQWTHKELKDK